jgi:hypothetical protein
MLRWHAAWPEEATAAVEAPRRLWIVSVPTRDRFNPRSKSTIRLTNNTALLPPPRRTHSRRAHAGRLISRERSHQRVADRAAGRRAKEPSGGADSPAEDNRFRTGPVLCDAGNMLSVQLDRAPGLGLLLHA